MKQAIISGDNILIVVDGRSASAPISSIDLAAVLKAAQTEEWETALKLCSPSENVKAVLLAHDVKGLSFNTGILMYRGVQFPAQLYQYVVNAANNGLDMTPIVAFMDRLMKNPDHRVFQQLFGFLEYGKMQINDNGTFAAYKKVKADYTSIYDGKTSNKVGETPELSRSLCDSDPDSTCSTGLHFCSREYLPNYGGTSGVRIVLLEIDPADVVSIPTDYNNTKGRACRYTVTEDVTDSLSARIDNYQIGQKPVVAIKTIVAPAQPTKQVEEPKKVVVNATPVVVYTARMEYLDGYHYKLTNKNATLPSWASEWFARGFNDKKNHKKRKFAA